MAYLTKHELKDSLAAGNHVDASVQKAIINQLIADGVYTSGPSHARAEVAPTQVSSGRPVQVLDAAGTYTIVNTDSDPALKVVIADTSKDATVIVHGSHHGFLGLATGGDQGHLTD